jgi:glycerophosphoryl diester phosphodiesterase
MKFILKYRLRRIWLFPLLAFLASCNVQDQWLLDVPVIETGSVLTGTSGLSSGCKYAIEGIYHVISGSEVFGDTLVLKDTGNRISLFCKKDGSYFILDAGSRNSSIMLEGYWRKAFSDESGLTQISITDASALIEGDTTVMPVMISGKFGFGEVSPYNPFAIELVKRFSPGLRHDPFIIGAHRGGGRTSDKLPVSENSVEMINYTSYFGSTGIEIDVRLTKDKIPVLYHDEDLNIRLIRKGPLFGKIGDYSYSQLQTMVRLIHGEKIPTLQEAFDAVLANPLINTVWLDMKDVEGVNVVIPLQLDCIDRAKKAGRNLQVLIGLPADDIFNQFISYPGYQNIPSLCELTPLKVTAANARAWGFRWTQGLMQQDVINMHSQGRKCLVWTLDIPEFTEIYTTTGGNDPSKRFDGILTNYPSVLAYYHYVRHNF